MSESLTRALLFVKQGRYREAEFYLRQAIQNDPQDPQGFFFLATCLMHDPKNRLEALSMIDQALRLRPSRAFYHAQRANILVLLSRTKEAMLGRASESSGAESADSYVAESVVMLVSGNRRRQSARLVKLLRLMPKTKRRGTAPGGRAPNAGQAG
jgi:tetratricopeptide (TPR) repeat protein